MIVASCPSGILVPSCPSISIVRIALRLSRRSSRSLDDEVEPALAHPNLRRLLTDQTDPDRSDDVSRRQANSRRRLSVDGDLQLRQTRQFFRA